MSRLAVPLAVLVVVAILVSTTIGVSIGLAYVLNWLVPAFDLTTSAFLVLAAFMFWGVIGFGFMMATTALTKSKIAELAGDESDEDHGSEILEMHADLVADRLVEAISERMDLPPRRRTRR